MLLSPSLAPIPENFGLDDVMSPSDTPPLTPLGTPQDEPVLGGDGDLEVFSSDGMSFKTSLSLLRASSTSFASVTKPSKPGHRASIHFTDHHYESSQTITLFLHLLSFHSLPPPTPQTFTQYEILIHFLRKYRCSPMLVQELGKQMRGWLENGNVSASKVFRAGCAIGDDQLCKEAVAAGNEWTWCGQTKTNMPPSPSPTSPLRHTMTRSSSPPSVPDFNIREDGITGAPALDISAMPFSFFKSLPDEHKFALMRATRNVVGPTVILDHCDWDKVAGEFEKILKEIKHPN